ncbi:MAG: FtsH protease activity modulator HflK [Deltaproteobacteria bacterium]|nr:FtsH protease activity modulator HflK [Deltaproteobacteria bacterium]
MSDNQQPQWGRKKPSSPEDLIAALLQKIKNSFEGGSKPPRGNSQSGDTGKMPEGFKFTMGKVLLIVGVFVLINLVSASFYTILPGEKGVVLRFGKFHAVTNPGLNFKLPLLDTLYKVDVKTIRKQEFGFRTRVPGQKTIFEKRGYQNESLMLTGDKNVIDIAWIVQYKVRDPVNFLFKVRNVDQAVRDVSEKALRQVVGNQDFDYALSNRDVIESATARQLQQVMNKYQSGIKIVTVKLQDVNPPDAVKPAFNEVNEADQDMKRLVNEAEATYNKVIPKAKGQAKQILEEAHGYAIQRTNLAQGEAARFTDILKQYRLAKQVTRRRMYLETMQEILPKVKSVYVIDSKQRAVLPFMDIGKTMQGSK